MKKQRTGIRARLTYSFMGITIITVFVFIMLVSAFLKQYYYKSVEDILGDQISMSANFYTRYFADSTLEDHIMDNVDVFWRLTSAQVQILDDSGLILMDSIGVHGLDRLDSPDFHRALSGGVGKWVGKMPYTDETMMSVTHPLEANDQIIGVLRFTTSLTPINNQLRDIITVFIFMGILVIGISGIISFVLAKGIVGPIKQVTKVAEKMARGDFEVRSTKKSNDEVGRLSDTLNYMADELIEKERIKNEFLASVSHELRTPLTSIKGWAIILKGTHPKEETTFNDGLKIIEEETERLSVMVEELLDFSKLLSGGMTLKMEEVNIERLIEYIRQHMTPIAQRNKMEFIVEYSKYLPSTFMDENRIKQVLINILNNAFKFTDQGGIIRFTTYAKDSFIVMKIEDNGCGIPPNELPYIKEKFYKGKNSKASNGIGLSVCNEIIARHKGQLIIGSQEAQGTRVFVELPII
ncbi:MAG TPA: HAMP domain-containing sensor histidine kinase [Clostridia bacterium]|nr:HAMP domain-containing sensor histidine kinase [Clostridia bacterium]